MGRHSRWSILEGEAPAEPNLEGEAPAEPFQPTPHQDRNVFVTHVGSRGRSPSTVRFEQIHQSVPTILKTVSQNLVHPFRIALSFSITRCGRTLSMHWWRGSRHSALRKRFS
ncbi:hypothetical protein HRbin15_00379 [bacterium HR15]|nr:hypothetical protein HRbin15_00379 [bacterium HR15]